MGATSTAHGVFVFRVLLWSLFSVALLYFAVPAHAGYWTADSAGSTCASQFQGVQYEGDDFGSGLQAAEEYFDCMFPTYGHTCYVNKNDTPECQSNQVNYVFTEASHHCYSKEGRTSDGLCAITPEALTCSLQNKVDGNPVEIATGRKVQTTVDWTSHGTDPLTFTRYYASQFRVFSDQKNEAGYSRLGQGWRSNFDSRAGYDLSYGSVTPDQAVAGDLVHVMIPNSIQYSFRKTSGGSWEPVAVTAGSTAGTNVWVARTDLDIAITVDGNGIVLKIMDGTTYAYDNEGLLTRITFPSGYSQFLEYVDGRNTRVLDSLGRSISFAYEDDVYRTGFLKSATMPDGSKISFEYVNRLIPLQGSSTVVNHSQYALGTVIYPDDTPATDTDNPRLSYQYLNDIKYPYALTGITDERGVQYGAWTYDSKGRVLTSQHDGGADLTSFAYDDVANTVTVTNPLGRQTVYSFTTTQSVFKRLVAVDGVATTNCAASNTAYENDNNGFRTKATDAEGRITTWQRNSRGLPTSTTEGFGTADARTTTTTWDATRPLPTQIVQPGRTTDIAYTSQGLITSTTETDTTATTSPYSTNGQTRTTTFGYTPFTPPQPPAVGPTGTALTPITLTIVNGDAETGPTTGGITGWTNEQGTLAILATGLNCSATDRCFWGKTSTPVKAYQDIAITDPTVQSEIDSGRRAAVLSWQQSSTATYPDFGAVQLEFRNASGTVLDKRGLGHINLMGWHDRENVSPVPAGTRTIRVRMIMIKNTNGTNDDAYIDDIAVTLIADGTASESPFLPVTNPSALTGNTSGWTTTSGSINTSTAAPCQFMACFKANSANLDSFYQDITIPSDRLSEVDGAARGVELRYVARDRSAQQSLCLRLRCLAAPDPDDG